MLIFSGILLSSCSKENEENPAINIPINEVISSTVLNDIKNHMPIYEEWDLLFTPYTYEIFFNYWR